MDPIDTPILFVCYTYFQNMSWIPQAVKTWLTFRFLPAATENGGGGDDIVGDNEEDEEDDREFWNLMKDPAVSEAKMNRAIKRMVQASDRSRIRSRSCIDLRVIFDLSYSAYSDTFIMSQSHSHIHSVYFIRDNVALQLVLSQKFSQNLTTFVS